MTTNGSGQNIEEQKFEKTVQVVAYLNYPDDMSLRNIAADMRPGFDWYRREEFESETKVVNVMGLSHEVDDELHEAISGANSGEITTDVITETRTPYEHSVRKLAKEVFNDLAENLPETILGEYSYRSIFQTWENPDRETVVNVYRYADTMPMLKKPHKIEDDDLYEGDKERPVLKYKIKVEAETEDDMDEIQVIIIDQVVDMLGNMNAVDTVRWYNCERIEKVSGSCINI